MQKISRKFLLIFSTAVFAAGGIAWACADSGYDDSDSSNFTPEAFVSAQYAPFFYASSISYYGYPSDDSNTRFNEQVLKEWQDYFGKQLDKETLNTLLFKVSGGGLDSISGYLKGKISVLPQTLPDLKKSALNSRQQESFLAYLKLAKECESFTVNQQYYSWDEKVVPKVPAADSKTKILKAFQESKDSFFKERLWFQLVRYTYFEGLQDSTAQGKTVPEIVALFNKYESGFPKNMIYYRAMGYVAGYYYKHKEYAQANYLYSLCYNFSQEMKVPGKWSFHPQNENDWEKSLSLAKNTEEKITLWQMLGIYNDESRAISKIYALDPKSEKLELLLSRLINITEFDIANLYNDTLNNGQQEKLNKERTLVSMIAKNNNTAKPFFWNLAAGYLHTFSGNYAEARSFYDKAKTQLPQNDRLIQAQYRILDWTLYLSQLKKIGAKEESEMVGPLNWLADLRDSKDTVLNLRYSKALGKSISTLAALYKKQGDQLKSNAFSSETAFYTSNLNIEAMKKLLSSTSQTPFEKVMLRYYPISLEELNYHQGLMLVYQEKTDQAIAYMEKSGKNATFELLANPFSIRINDCHDCDFAVPRKNKYSPLSFLKAVRKLKTDIVAGKDMYVNTFLLADAYYNITHYGNARTFYQNSVTGSDATSPMDIAAEFRSQFTSSKIAEKYYLLARTYAKTKDQKTRCTFMAAKCERNEIYNTGYREQSAEHKYYWDFDFSDIPVGKYFAELKTQYFQTPYYQEILKECGYFKSYVNKH